LADAGIAVDDFSVTPGSGLLTVETLEAVATNANPIQATVLPSPLSTTPASINFVAQRPSHLWFYLQ